jgi:outer membrane protein TolC
VGSAETAYWTVVSAREALGVQIKARDAQKANWDFVQQQLQLGAISVLDTYTPQTSLAQAEASVAQATFNLAQVEDQLRTQMAADLDPDIRKLPLNLTEPVDIAPSEAIAPDKETAVSRALTLQPSLKTANQNLDVDDLSLASAQNLLLPQLNFRMGYSTAGNGGYYVPGFGASGPVIPGGLGDALGQAFGLGNPTYAASLTLTLPIRSRSASMALANALVQKKLDTFSVRSTQQNIRLQVLNAVTGLAEALEVLKLDKTADDFAIKQLDADQQKYKLGTEVLQFVVNSEVTLAQADLNLVNAKIAVRNAITSLYAATGELLDQRGIVIR